MIGEKHESEQREDGSSTDENIAPPTPERSFAVIALSALLCVLLAAVAAGNYYHFTSNRALDKAIGETQMEILRTDKMLADTQLQIAGLSRQIHALRLLTIDSAEKVAAQIVARSAAHQ